MLDIYKKGQGATARWVTAGALGALAAFGCYELEEFLSIQTKEAMVFGGVSWSFLLSVAAFVVAVLVVAMIANSKRFVDYLIASETELKKVAWPTKSELKRQTMVVIVTLGIFAALLFVADLVFALGSQALFLRNL